MNEPWSPRRALGATVRRLAIGAPLSSGGEHARSLADVLRFFAWAITSGVAMVLMVSMARTSAAGSWLAVAGGMLLNGGASAATGALLGFLFGIPRARQATGSDRVDFTPNTNLEEISDWLTKIIVGLGLANLTQVRALLVQAANRLAPALQPLAGDLALGLTLGLFTYFGVTGFLGGYALTRLFLAPALITTDRRLRDLEQLADVPVQVPLDGGTDTVLSAEPGLNARAALASAATRPSTDRPRDLRGWAKAQLAVDATEEAVDALSELVQREPRNATYQYEYGVALTRQRRRGDAIAAFQRALSGPTPPADVLTGAVEGQMHNRLYLQGPEGAEAVLALGRQYLNQPGFPPRARVHMYVACAHGQLHARAVGSGDRESAAHHRDGALEAVRTALALDPGLGGLMRRFVDGTGGIDNDLQSLADDADLRALLGISPDT